MIFSRLRRALPLSSGVAATVQTLLAQTLILALNFGTGVITARALGPDGRGAQAAMQMWPQFFAIAFTFGLPSAMLYNMKRYPERASQLFSAALLMGTGLGLLAIPVGIAFTTLWLTQYPPEVIHSAKWLMLIAPLILLNAVFRDVLRAREEFAAFNATQYVIPALTLLALISLGLMDRLTPLSAALSYALPAVPVFLWLIVRLCRIYDLTLRNLRVAFRSLTSYGTRSYWIDLLGQVVAGRLDRILVVGLLEPAAMGLYVVALSLSRTILICSTAVGRVVFPKATGRPLEEIVGLIGLSVRVSTGLALLGALVLAISGPWLLELIYGEDFVGALAVFRLLLVETVLSGATWVLGQAFMASNRPGTVSIVQGIGVGLTIPLLVILVPRYGLVGAGLAMLISTVFRFVVAMVSFPARLGVRPPSLWLRWGDVTTIIRRRDDG